MPKQMTRADIERMCALYEGPLSVVPHYSIAPDAVFRLHNTIALGLKYHRVCLLPGLYGMITSDDGKEITIKYHDARSWLDRQGGAH